MREYRGGFTTVVVTGAEPLPQVLGIHRGVEARSDTEAILLAHHAINRPQDGVGYEDKPRPPELLSNQKQARERHGFQNPRPIHLNILRLGKNKDGFILEATFAHGRQDEP